MRRSIRNRELEDIAGQGEKLKYKGTTPGTDGTAGGGGSGGQSGGGGGSAQSVMSKYILKESQLSADELKTKRN